VSPDAWPTPSEGASREPLPRVEDLPVAEHGYDQASVKAAFDSFYRHAAQLDAALRTLEAVDSFHRQAAALRADLRTLRTAGWTQQSLSAPPAYGYDVRGAPREGISPAVWRILGEVVFLIAVSVFLGVAKVPWWVIVSVMGGAFVIVAVIEWAASRDRWSAAPAAQPSVAPHPVVEAQPETPRTDEGESIGWAAYEQPQEPSDAMTMIGGLQELPAQEGAPAPVEASADEPGLSEPEAPAPAQAAQDPVAPPEPPGESVPDSSRRWWRRRAAATDEPAPEPQEEPRHVRVLGADEDAVEDVADPWERGFDPGADGDGGEAEGPEAAENTADDGTPVAADAEASSRRRFRRR
jgi:hypothetical protein